MPTHRPSADDSAVRGGPVFLRMLAPLALALIGSPVSAQQRTPPRAPSAGALHPTPGAMYVGLELSAAQIARANAIMSVLEPMRVEAMYAPPRPSNQLSAHQEVLGIIHDSLRAVLSAEQQTIFDNNSVAIGFSRATVLAELREGEIRGKAILAAMQQARQLGCAATDAQLERLVSSLPGKDVEYLHSMEKSRLEREARAACDVATSGALPIGPALLYTLSMNGPFEDMVAGPRAPGRVEACRALAGTDVRAAVQDVQSRFGREAYAGTAYLQLRAYFIQGVGQGRLPDGNTNPAHQKERECAMQLTERALLGTRPR